MRDLFPVRYLIGNFYTLSVALPTRLLTEYVFVMFFATFEFSVGLTLRRERIAYVFVKLISIKFFVKIKTLIMDLTIYFDRLIKFIQHKTSNWFGRSLKTLAV